MPVTLLSVEKELDEVSIDLVYPEDSIYMDPTLRYRTADSDIKDKT